MSQITDYYVATPEEICAAFPEMAPAKVIVVFRPDVCPFQQISLGPDRFFTEYMPDLENYSPPIVSASRSILGRLFGPSNPAAIAVVATLPQLLWNNVGPIELASLYDVVFGLEGETAMDELLMPAMLPADGSEGLTATQLPIRLTTALGAIEDDAMATTAEAWRQRCADFSGTLMTLGGWTLEDVVDALTGLRHLSQTAAAGGRCVYLLWGS